VVRQDEIKQDVVRFGATVELVDENGKKSSYQIVGPDEADPSKGRISFRSPLGESLMKRKVGDVIIVRRPAGEIEVEIRSITYE
jgi:transcription elongation factor GreB